MNIRYCKSFLFFIDSIIYILCDTLITYANMDHVADTLAGVTA